MDLKKKAEEIFDKIKGDKDFAKKFEDDPVKAVESVIGIDLPEDKIQPVVDAVKAKLTADKAGGIIGKIKDIF